MFVQVHNLEHGTVVVQYLSDLDDAGLSQIQEFAREKCTHILVAPREDLTHPVVLTGWTKMLRLETADLDVMGAFYDRLRDVALRSGCLASSRSTSHSARQWPGRFSPHFSVGTITDSCQKIISCRVMDESLVVGKDGHGAGVITRMVGVVRHSDDDRSRCEFLLEFVSLSLPRQFTHQFS